MQFELAIENQTKNCVLIFHKIHSAAEFLSLLSG